MISERKVLLTVVGLTPVLVDVYFSTSSSTVIFPPFVASCSK